MNTLKGSDIHAAKSFLDKGEVVAIPTETVYGLAANALDETAVSSIFRIKDRPTYDPLIVHFCDMEQVLQYTLDVPENALLLARAFWPGPLTLILPKKNTISDLVTSGQKTVGCRMPDHPLSLGLLKSIDYPLAAPSANPFKYVSPTTAEHVITQLEGKVPYVLDGGPCRVGLESTIVAFNNDIPHVLRLGGITIEALQEIVPETILRIQHVPNSPVAPGQLLQHYAPTVRFLPIQTKNNPTEWNHNEGVLYFKCPESLPEELNSKHIKCLSQTGDVNEAATHLYSKMREFDKMDLECVYFEWAPKEGLGLAINDRLERAQSK